MSQARTLEPKRLVLTAVAALACAMFFLPKPTHAMTVSPPTLDFTLNPGDVVADVIQVYNEEGIPFKITTESVNFDQSEDDEITGAPNFYSKSEVRTGYELAPWFHYNTTPTVIPPNQRINIPFEIRVPKDAQPGSHYGAIQIIASKPDEITGGEEGTLGVDRGTSVLIFVRVTGDTKDDLKVMGFNTQKELLSHLPADFTIRLKNEGNTHLRPVGNVIIEDMFGRQVAAVQVNPGPQYKSILPGSYRRFDASWFRHKLADSAGEYTRELNNFAFGRYTATLLLNYGAPKDQKNLSAVTVFWVFPWMVLSVGVVLLIVALLALKFVLRGYKRHVINQFQKKQN